MTSPSSAQESPRLERRYPHPLEAIPFFRRFPQTPRRDILYTSVLCAAVAVLLSVIAWATSITDDSFLVHLARNSAFSFSIGYGIRLCALFTGSILSKWLGPESRFAIIGLGLSWIVGGFGGYMFAAAVMGIGLAEWSVITMFVIWVTAMMSGLVLSQRQRMLAELALEREHRARVEAERLTVASRLQMLQAQIEPHFLFNTLANVSTLIEVEPKRARKMLDELTLLLRAALDSTRRPMQTLRKELEVIDAYLAVLKVRMGERLAYQIHIPADLLEVEVPAMLMQPVVENAVKHGIEPRVHGGIVRVEIAKLGQSLELAVLDNGVGFAPTSKDNVGLGAVRERLNMQFGSEGGLRTERTTDHWTRVTIRIPMSS